MSIGGAFDPTASTGSMTTVVNTGIQNLEDRAKDIKDEIEKLQKPGMTQEEQTSLMLKTQFKLGQYNAIVELTSNITKNVSDTAKSISQKAS